MDMTRTLLSIILLLALSLSLVSGDVLSMGTMIDWEDESTHSIFDVMTRFNLYGCYCGFGGQGVPVDKIDCCCRDHDECYDNLAKDGTCLSGDTGVGKVYKYTKVNKDGKHTVQCKPSSDTCAEKICECDKALAECFSTNERYYNSANRNYNRGRLCAKQMAKSCPNFNQKLFYPGGKIFQ